MRTMNDNHDVWFLRYRGVANWNWEFGVIFCPFYHPNNLEKSKSWRNEKTIRDVVLLHMCTINEDHTVYGSWDIRHGRQNLCVNLSQFLLFYPHPTDNLKNQNFEKMKNPLRYRHLTHVYQKSGSYAILFLRYGLMDVIFIFKLRLSFALLPT